MNVQLLKPHMGHAAGTYEVHSVNAGTATLKDDKGALFEVPVSLTEELVPPAAPEPEAPPARFEVDEYTEAQARSMYDDYCAAVGGTAFNGDPLPPASEFFEDPAKQKQANAWRVTAAHAIDRIGMDTLKNMEEATGTDLCGEGLPDGLIGSQDPEKDLIGDSAASSTSETTTAGFLDSTTAFDPEKLGGDA